MSGPTLSRTTGWRLGVVATAIGALAIGGPAVAALAGGGGQPPAGFHPSQPHVRNAPNTQPPPGAPAVRSTAKNAPNTQPVNLHPEKPGKPTTVHRRER